MWITINFRTRPLAEIYFIMVTYLDVLVEGIIGGLINLFIMIYSSLY